MKGDNDESLRMCMGGIDGTSGEMHDDDEEEIPDELRGDYIDEVTGATMKMYALRLLLVSICLLGNGV